MSIEEINERLRNLSTGKLVKIDPTIHIASQYALNYKNDVEYLLNQNKRLLEALEQIAEWVGHEESYDIRKRALDAVSEESNGYKLPDAAYKLFDQMELGKEIIGKHEEIITVTETGYVNIEIEEDGNGNNAGILLFPQQAEELIEQIQLAIKSLRGKG